MSLWAKKYDPTKQLPKFVKLSDLEEYSKEICPKKSFLN